MKVYRGDIYNCTLPQHNVNRHSVTTGYRPVVIISSAAGLMNTDIVTICPLTTRLKQHSVNVDVSWSKDGKRRSQVLCNQIMTIPRASLQNRIGALTEQEMIDVTSAVAMSLGIVPAFRKELMKSIAAMNEAKADRERLEVLLPQAREIHKELTALLNKNNITPKGRIKRSKEMMAEFVKEWEDPHNDRRQVAEAFQYTYAAAAQAYRRYKEKVKKGENNGS